MRFKLEKSIRTGYWVCTDTVNLIVCTFRQGDFNNEQVFITLEDFNPDNFMNLALYAREMGDWLKENHYDIIF